MWILLRLVKLWCSDFLFLEAWTFLKSENSCPDETFACCNFSENLASTWLLYVTHRHKLLRWLKTENICILVPFGFNMRLYFVAAVMMNGILIFCVICTETWRVIIKLLLCLYFVLELLLFMCVVFHRMLLFYHSWLFCLVYNLVSLCFHLFLCIHTNDKTLFW